MADEIVYNIRALSSGDSDLVNRPTTEVLPLTEPIVATAARNGATWNFTQFADVDTVVRFGPFNDAEDSLAVYPGLPTLNRFAGVDDHFGGLVINLTGLTSDSTFVIETRHCVEMQACPDSPYASVASTGTLDRAALDAGLQIHDRLPVAAPSDTYPGIVEKALRGFGTNLQRHLPTFQQYIQPVANAASMLMMQRSQVPRSVAALTF